MAQSEPGRKNWEKVKGWGRKIGAAVNSLPLQPFDPLKAGKELTKYVSMPVRVGESAQAAIDRKAGKIPAGVVKSPNAPRSSSGPGKASSGSKKKAAASTSPNAPRKTGGADRATEKRAVGRAAPPPAGPKTKDGKPSQMPAKSARTVPSGKAPVPKARPSGKAKAAAAPVPKARPASGPQRKPTTQPAKSASPNVARTAAPAPQKAVDTPWWKKGANTPFRRGPLASKDK